ncbi:hypothetical protein [Aquimarina rhabdastrellae]
MSLRTIETYRKEILAFYKRTSGGALHHYLATPTPRSLKDACEDLYGRRNDTFDDYILQAFFRFKPDEDPISVIKNFDIDKFKPIQNFLKEKTVNTNKNNLNLIAWLIDFKPRPHFLYIKENTPIEENIDMPPQKENHTYIRRVKLAPQNKPTKPIALLISFILLLAAYYQIASFHLQLPWIIQPSTFDIAILQNQKVIKDSSFYIHTNKDLANHFHLNKDSLNFLIFSNSNQQNSTVLKIKPSFYSKTIMVKQSLPDTLIIKLIEKN